MATDQLLKDYQHFFRNITKKEEKKAFINHSIIFVVINIALIIVNLVFDPEDIWFYWPLLGWGLGLAGHYWALRNVDNELERKESLAEKRLKERD